MAAGFDEQMKGARCEQLFGVHEREREQESKKKKKKKLCIFLYIGHYSYCLL